MVHLYNDYNKKLWKKTLLTLFFFKKYINFVTWIKGGFFIIWIKEPKIRLNIKLLNYFFTNDKQSEFKAVGSGLGRLVPA